VKLYTVHCDAPGLPLSASGVAPSTPWCAGEQIVVRTRGGAIVAPKQLPIQGTSVRTVATVNADFPYMFHVRAGAQDLT
jgi:hypothetical protein